MISARIAAWILALAPLSLFAVENPPPPFASVQAILLRESPSLAWKERQFLQADKQGRVFLLRAGTLEVFAVTGSGGLEPKGRLEGGTQDGKGAPIEAAAMSSAGDLWVLFSKPNRLEVFQSGKRRETVECPWLISTVSAPAGDPIVSTLPARISTATDVGFGAAAPPSLVRWDGKRWSAAVEEGRGELGEVKTEAVENVGRMERMRGEFFRRVTGAANGALWAADRYAYRLRAYTPLGVLKDEIRVGEGAVAWSERSAEEWKRAEATARAEGVAFGRQSLSRVRALEVVRAMTMGRDGALYLIVQAGDGLALDRFDPVLLRLERINLLGIESVPGNLTLAAGTQGLYLAAPSGRLGLWRIDGELLEKADWKAVPGASLNGQPLEPEKAPASAATTVPGS